MNESIPKSPVARKRTLRRYIVSFAFVFLAVFSIANSSLSGIQLATGANRWLSYGWPSSWLRLHTYVTDSFSDGHREHEFRFEGAEVISWSSCFASVAACGGISAGLVAIPALAHRAFFSTTSHPNDRNA